MLDSLLQAHEGLIIFLLAIFASLGVRLSTLYHPNLILSLVFKAIAERVYRPKAASSYQLLSGTLGFLLPILTITVLTHAIISFAFYPNWLGGLVLFLCLDISHESRVKRISALIKSKQKVTARAVLQGMVARDVEKLTELGICKAAIDSTALNTLRHFFVIALLYLAAGPYLALFYKLLLLCDHAWRQVMLPSSRFMASLSRMIWLVEFVPIRLLITCFSLLLRPKQTWHYIKYYGRHFSQTNTGWALSFFAANLHTQLAGPRFYFGERFDVMRVGAKAQPSSEHIQHLLGLLNQMRWLFIATSALLLVIINFLRLMA
ncbi:cobalamin biosynthesis protein [Pseudoalteromonas piscicida]|uniref:Adenosylcobinamide-phosphate synthase n=1 Tax=Pseudoalteromonas piscicida TaxID=43662 RepID=A0ABN5CPH2_PSEO7|nr:cobalamin biosynthesis protein [Pseudoalteromonas piscicida]ATD09206.1 adenosylcobinamide-phosphate synthase [Pseudoalteromonas piscicida]WPU31165.1 cobalamin biosynthesis protein [Pseudoalteromonas piscicida]